MMSGEFYRCIVGSTLSGLSTELSDRDEMGIRIEPRESVTGIIPYSQTKFRSQPEGKPSQSGDVDLTVYGLRHWLKLATQGNPNSIDLLFVPESLRLIDTPIAHSLRGLKSAILSKKCANAYVGYLASQRKLMEKDTLSPQRLARFYCENGYDTKAAMHMLRLGFQGIELLDTGAIQLPLTGKAKAICLATRGGIYPKQSVLNVVFELQQELEESARKTSLPDGPNIRRINDWLHETYLSYWNEESN